MAKITFVNGREAGESRDIDGGKPVTIGRGKDCDVVLADAVVSNHHARIERAGGGWTITDLGSSNGTLVDGRRIERPTVIGNGALVDLGNEVVFRFHAAADHDLPMPEATPEELALIQQMSERTRRIRREVAKVIVGQSEVVEQIMAVLLAGGHGLLVGMPGMAKTLMVSTVARVLDLEFRRIQFTPDLMPSDMTGTEVLETDRSTQEKAFRFIRGPIFCNLLLADEINRTPPKTQAALLEAMQEKRVTVGNVTYPLDPPFFVLATQNPIEQEGTYPLPEAQLDRFMFNIWVDYPQEHEEEEIVRTTTAALPGAPDRILTKADVLQLQSVVRKIPVSPHVIKYTIRLVRATRPGDARAPDFVRQFVSTGAGPRAGQYLVLAAKACAVMEGRLHVSCNDIRRAALPVLRHRILTNFAADSEGLTPVKLVERLLTTVEEPSEKDYT